MGPKRKPVDPRMTGSFKFHDPATPTLIGNSSSGQHLLEEKTKQNKTKHKGKKGKKLNLRTT